MEFIVEAAFFLAEMALELLGSVVAGEWDRRR
jgi:hypothetical protein